MYELNSENLTNLGGPMGSDYTFSNWRKFFKTIKSAKEYAEKDYGKKINWKKHYETISSGDLSYVMYEINKVKTED